MSRYLLALETSAGRGGVALVRDGELVGEITLEEGMRHGRSLLPAARELLQQEKLKVSDLACVAVSVGPGSYTGVRIGVMCAKSLAWAVHTKLVAVSSLAALALAAKDSCDIVVPVQYARRDEVYCAEYAFNEYGLPVVSKADSAITPEEAASFGKGAGYLLAGSGVAEYGELLREKCVAGTEFDEALTAPSAAAVSRLGWDKFVAGNHFDPLELQPVYIRRQGDPGNFG